MECPKCNKEPTETEKTLPCTLCKNIYHTTCLKISNTAHQHASKITGFQWYCPRCNTDDTIRVIRDAKNFLDKLEELTKQIEELKMKINNVRPINNTTNGDFPRTTIQEIVREEQDFQRRRLNLCIFNLPNSNND